ncbi:uncharacterized protein GGS22DRAFT_160548 [Annulohypoxylon maeteangense]|uniref:uncharacterized protein n=1 Tax=Annulohypoxylon maeteangense TaxID=1927788 RepID=UPI0020084EFF|nr:uncharacterized protein GGS22DRAFT_160548 [Annulohypoxylon maeteangense]KAI0886311.1 hypothetical protein GGS22DRAFT_160548 [Annulohypoxylon maeteangense]
MPIPVNRSTSPSSIHLTINTTRFFHFHQVPITELTKQAPNMADCGLPFPVVCIQCGRGVGLCGIKVIGPTIGFCVAVLAAFICWPIALLFCCFTETGKKWFWKPCEINGQVSDLFPI